MTDSVKSNWEDRLWALHVTALGERAGTIDDQRFLALAIAGEAGELANVFKKDWRRDFGMSSGMSLDEFQAKVADELADVVAYCKLLARTRGIDLDKVGEQKHLLVERRLEYQLPHIIAALKALDDSDTNPA